MTSGLRYTGGGLKLIALPLTYQISQRGKEMKAKKIALEFGSQMTFQNVNLNDAYKILDYLRFENSDISRD